MAVSEAAPRVAAGAVQASWLDNQSLVAPAHQLRLDEPLLLDGGRTLTGSHCLLTVGMIPRTGGIGLDEAGVKDEAVCYVGDDVIDLPVMRRVGLAVAVPNARQIVKAHAHFITERSGGEGAARDTIEYVLSAQGTLDDAISAYIHERIEDTGQ